MGSGQYKSIQTEREDPKNQGNHVTIVGKFILQNSAPHSAKHAISIKRRGISLNFVIHVQAPDHHQMIKDNPIRIFTRLHNQMALMVICSHLILMYFISILAQKAMIVKKLHLMKLMVNPTD